MLTVVDRSTIPPRLMSLTHGKGQANDRDITMGRKLGGSALPGPHKYQAMAKWYRAGVLPGHLSAPELAYYRLENQLLAEKL
jgi:hypothetical protein